MNNNRLNRITRVLIVLTLLILIASTFLTKVLYALWEGKEISYAQSLLFVLQTLTTTGYGELLPFHSWGMNLYAAFLMLAGLSLVFILLATAAAEWLKEHFEEVPSHRVGENVRRHVILTAYNAITDSILGELSGSGLSCVVISKRAEDVRDLSQRGITAIQGNAAEREVLVNANIHKADALVALDCDEENMKVVLEVRAMTDIPVYVFVEDGKYQEVLKLAGADKEIFPKWVLGEELARWALSNFHPNVISEIGNIDDLHIIEFPLGLYLRRQTPGLRPETLEKKTGVIVLGVWENGVFKLLKDKHTPLTEESVMVVIGTRRQLEELSRHMTHPPHHTDECNERYLLGGYGQVARKTIGILQKEGKEVKVIVKEPIEGHGFIVGDITSKEVLLRAGIMNTGTYIISVDRDDHAILSVLIARDLNPDLRIIVRANSHYHVSKLYRAGADFVLSISKVGGGFLSRSLLGQREHIWSGRNVHFCQIGIGRDMAGKKLSEAGILEDNGCYPAALERAGELIPSPVEQVTLQEGDRVILIGSESEIQRFQSRDS